MDVIENFHGVYLLYCTNPHYKGQTYIGYTTDPNRRIKQHNKGKHAGGARRTSNRGPWEMVLIIHGFPNDISALRFEWAWQHPEKSRRLRGLVPSKSSKENKFQHQVKILAQMLQIGPWYRLPLTVRWLLPQYTVEFPAGEEPPLHMPLCEGPVDPKKAQKEDSDLVELVKCFQCGELVEDLDSIQCLACPLEGHMSCLAEAFHEQEREFCDHKNKFLIPIQGNCPACNTHVLWGDLVKKKRGCYGDLDVRTPS